MGKISVKILRITVVKVDLRLNSLLLLLGLDCN